MEMSFQQYIDNPMGKKNAVFSQRDMYKRLYTEKFDKVFLREAGKINFTLYIDKKKDQYIAHIKVPSETVKGFYYDAVILFYANDAAIKASPSLQHYFVKFFSNDPAFVFTYLRVFLKNDLFIEDLKPKASKLALKKDPKEKNPYGVPGYSKILYFAYIFMKNKSLFSKHMYNTYAIPYDIKKLLASVDHTDKKIAERMELGKQQQKAEAKERRKEKQAASKSDAPEGISNQSGNITVTARTKNANSIKNTATVKTTQKTKTVSTTKRK